jgi:hypothetical protein
LKGVEDMLVLRLVECTDCDEEYGVLVIKTEAVTEEDVQKKIYEYKNSYKAYGYDSLEDMRADGFETEEDLADSDICPEWYLDDMMADAFPDEWDIELIQYDGTVEC